MDSKIKEHASLKKFMQSPYGEAIIEVNDHPKTTLGVNNVFAFVTGTRNNPKIVKVLRFNVDTATEMQTIKERLYERGAFSNTYYSYLREYGLARKYSKKRSLDYFGYKEEVRRRSSGAEGDRIDENRRREQNRGGAAKETQANDIAPVKTSSRDDVLLREQERTISRLQELQKYILTVTKL